MSAPVGAISPGKNHHNQFPQAVMSVPPFAVGVKTPGPEMFTSSDVFGGAPSFVSRTLNDPVMRNRPSLNVVPISLLGDPADEKSESFHLAFLLLVGSRRTNAQPQGPNMFPLPRLVAAVGSLGCAGAFYSSLKGHVNVRVASRNHSPVIPTSRATCGSRSGSWRQAG